MRLKECKTVAWSRPAKNGPTRGNDHSVTSRTASFRGRADLESIRSLNRSDATDSDHSLDARELLRLIPKLSKRDSDGEVPELGVRLIQGGERGRFAMPIPLRSDFDARMVRAVARRSKDGPQARRLLALAAIYEGASRTEAAKVGGVTLRYFEIGRCGSAQGSRQGGL